MGEHNKPVLLFKTNHGKVFKALGSILNTNFTTATMIVVDQGIFIQEAYEKSMIFECKLNRDKFLAYKIPEVKPSKDGEESAGTFLVIGFDTSDFKSAMDKIGAPDIVEISLHPSNMEVCNVRISKGQNSVLEKKFALVKTSIGDVVPPVYVDHLPTVTMPAAEFKTAVSSISRSKNSTITIDAQKEGISIKDSNSNISSNGCILGTWDPSQPILCSFCISLSRFHSFVEVHSISTKQTIRIYALPNLPLRLSADAGNLGTINMYLSSQNNNIIGE